MWYEELMQQLNMSGLRELEDLIITDCFYPKLLKGSLDQKQRCLQVPPFAPFLFPMLLRPTTSIPSIRGFSSRSGCSP